MAAFREIMRAKSRLVDEDERGSGTLLTIALVLVTFGIFTTLTIAANFLVSQIRIQHLADQLAIDASHAHRGLISGYPCDLAEELAKAQSASIESCEIVETAVRLELVTEHMGIVLRARAQAGN